MFDKHSWVLLAALSWTYLSSATTNSSNATTKLRCYYCRHSRRSRDVIESADQDPDCLSSEKMGHEMTRVCSQREGYCSSAVTNLNGFMVEINRDCSEVCEPGCWEHGFGLFHTICIRCCNSSLCNDFDKRDYYQPLTASRHFSPYLAAVIFSLYMCP
ncbi:hypothetical protein L596_012862 [Steinernema carpocapsae]|uniref:Snake toxin/toxin-like domain-containing protein n=1 Tax=Steinernema carpocapsae TaxID=34508 RepID=A0A4U5NZB7_STECR|nr:hypothetical protein L596_012862 [Steinernema carpocapsae]